MAPPLLLLLLLLLAPLLLALLPLLLSPPLLLLVCVGRCAGRQVARIKRYVCNRTQCWICSWLDMPPAIVSSNHQLHSTYCPTCRPMSSNEGPSCSARLARQMQALASSAVTSPCSKITRASSLITASACPLRTMCRGTSCSCMDEPVRHQPPQWAAKNEQCKSPLQLQAVANHEKQDAACCHRSQLLLLDPTSPSRPTTHTCSWCAWQRPETIRMAWIRSPGGQSAARMLHTVCKQRAIGL